MKAKSVTPCFVELKPASAPLRTNCRWPEREHHVAPVEMGLRYRLSSVRLRTHWHRTIRRPCAAPERRANAFRPLEARIAPSISTIRLCRAHMPLSDGGATRTQAHQVQDALRRICAGDRADVCHWLRNRYADPVHRAQPHGFRLRFTLHRMATSWHAARFAIVQIMNGDTEAARRTRIERACKKKYPSLQLGRIRAPEPF